MDWREEGTKSTKGSPVGSFRDPTEKMRLLIGFKTKTLVMNIICDQKWHHENVPVSFSDAVGQPCEIKKERADKSHVYISTN